MQTVSKILLLEIPRDLEEEKTRKRCQTMEELPQFVMETSHVTLASCDFAPLNTICSPIRLLPDGVKIDNVKFGCTFYKNVYEVKQQ